ncbi:hypothetical protein CBS101457_002042 [Exobasidium rhododendri]|nr:hypothetical protein CBS101457_002042 [Exobasidium rhododendri]
MATTASVYNASRTTRQVLKRHRKEGPSLTLHLHANTFRFEKQAISFECSQDGAFLCESPLKNLLYYIRDQKVPADLVDIFDEANVPFFEGCLIIEIHDHRSQSSSQDSPFPTPVPSRLVNGSSSSSSNENATTSIFNAESSARALGGNYGFLRRLGVDARKRNGDQSGSSGPPNPSVYRVVLYPSPETLWTDLRMLNEVEGGGLWTDEDVLEIESRILTLTSPPLCLTPDPQVSRIANLMLGATAPPCAYSPLPTAPLPYFRQTDRKRGINSIEVEMDEANKKRREKIMRMMEKGSSAKAKETIVGPSTHAPSFARMSFVERWRSMKATDAHSVKLTDGNGSGEGGAGLTGTADEQKAVSSKKKTKKKKNAADEEKREPKEATPPTTQTPKKKSKKKSQKEKEEKEERERVEQENAERAMAAAAAAAAASKNKTEETKKKAKKGKKKDKDAAAQAQIEAEAAAEMEASVTDSSKKLTKKASKSKKAKIQPSPVSNQTSTDTQQQTNALNTPQPVPMNSNSYPKHANNNNYMMMNQHQQNLGQGNPALFPGQFNSNNSSGISLPGGQTGAFSNGQQQQQQQQQQQAAIQRALQQSGMNSNFMMNSAHPNQMQQHLQALAAAQHNTNHAGSASPQIIPQANQQQGQQQHFNTQDGLPVGVGLGSLPPNWNSMS